MQLTTPGGSWPLLDLITSATHVPNQKKSDNLLATLVRPGNNTVPGILQCHVVIRRELTTPDRSFHLALFEARFLAYYYSYRRCEYSNGERWVSLIFWLDSFLGEIVSFSSNLRFSEKITKMSPPRTFFKVRFLAR